MKKFKKAAALKYEQGKDKAPKLSAKGKGLIAEKIIKKAQEHGVFIKEDPDLVEVLSTLDLYEEIPEYLYQAVADILIEIYKLNNSVKNNK
ncbi:EscU/YscU/HrcU family type III secretion system export apparatus switch protein [Deferribacter thermophilus]|uniref:EscU/YscU/HrcU family type III secretion system export apparatus switch protein n=1 Tax=Deferribacter thermophilus TaxID=53573 RepID=UPI003C14CFB6